MNLEDLSLVIPVINLGDLAIPLHRLESIPVKMITIIYDYSTAEDILKFNRFHLVQSHHPGEVGKAILQGIESSSTQKVIVTMGDGCDDWDDIPRLAQALDTCDLVCTNRLGKEGNYRGGNLLKELVTRMGARLLKKRWGWSLNDPTNNFKAYRKNLFQKIGPLSGHGFSFGLEVTVKAYLTGLKIQEIDSAWKDDSASYRWVKRIRFYLPLLIKRKKAFHEKC